MRAAFLLSSAWLRRVSRRVRAEGERLLDNFRPTFGHDPALPIEPYLGAPDLADLGLMADQVRLDARRFLDHTFDLLGSGPVRVHHGMTCVGFDQTSFPPAPPLEHGQAGQHLVGRLNRPNQSEASRRRALIEGPGYVPIDWQIDFKSGYRWDEGRHIRDIAYGEIPGADVKVAWELGRMQHLVQLAWAYALALADVPGFEAPERYILEFRNQVLDFMSANPPRYGVNWTCTMDVAIRATNWLVARDAFVAQGVVFDDAFDAAFATSIQEHGHFIMTHLEWSPRLRNNHYLANVAGLVVLAAYIRRSMAGQGWMRFALPELLNEISNQFGPDGACFEASTCYHRLSAEMVAYALSFAHRAGCPIPAEATALLARMARFTEGISGPDGRVPQIGDNDNGRFLKLFPARLAGGSVEDHLDHRHLIGAIAGSLGHAAGNGWPAPARLEYHLVRSLVATSLPGSAILQLGEPANAFPDFGIYVLRAGRHHLTVRCGPVGQAGNGGHAHNDQLAITLVSDGRPLLVDPGTYVYTPAPSRRNEFRSTRRHNTLAVPGLEQASWPPGRQGLFRLEADPAACAVYADSAAFKGHHNGFGVRHRRVVRLLDDQVLGTDELPGSCDRLVSFHFAPGIELLPAPGTSGVRVLSDGAAWVLSGGPGTWEIAQYDYSPGYGELERAAVATLTSAGNSMSWKLAPCMEGPHR